MNKKIATHIDDVHTVSVPVGDLDRALEFYKSKLGFEIRMDVPYGQGRRWIELAAPGATTTIALSPPGPGQTPGIDTGIRFTTRDVEADHTELRASGVDVDPEILRWPNSPPMFQMRDPDGNLLRMVQRVDRAQTAEQSSAPAKRFVILVKSDADTESGTMPDETDLTEMIRFNEEMANAGVMLAADGFHSSADGARVVFSGGSSRVVRGPFPEPTQLIAGYWMIRASSIDEAIDWMRRAPFGDGAEVEIRQVFEGEEFGEAYTPELREQEERQRMKMEANAKRRTA